MEWYLKAIKNYVGFTGRSRRKEFWMFVLFNLIFSIAAAVLDNVAGLADPMIGYGPIYGLYALAVLLPSLGVAVRRLHDVGKSGWFILIALVPLIGAIWLIVLYAKDGDPGVNKYGVNPKEGIVG
jgi:uncharacterized membrane protein YhaH (DUF805 family)